MTNLSPERAAAISAKNKVAKADVWGISPNAVKEVFGTPTEPSTYQAKSKVIDNIGLLLPFPPSANRYWRHANGRTYVSAQAKAYRAAVAGVVNSRASFTPIAGDLVCILSFDYPDKRKRDLDNLAKQVLDAMQLARVYEDDSQIVHLTLVRNSIRSVRSEAECLVSIRKFTRR